MKIIHIGLPKTGTTSLKAALMQLGLSVVQDNSSLYDFDLIKLHDGVVDIAGPCHYRMLDQLYPGARFVLTTRRDTTGWLRSCETWFAKYHGPTLLMHERWGLTRILGGWDFDAERLVRERDRHEQEVRDYFRERPGCMAEIDLAMPDVVKWEGLCGVVSEAFPGKPFVASAQGPWPHENRQF